MAVPLVLVSLCAILAFLSVSALRAPALVYAGALFIKPIDFLGQMAAVFFFENAIILNIVVLAFVVAATLRSLLKARTAYVSRSAVLALTFSLWSYAALSLLWSPAASRAMDVWIYMLPYLLMGAVLLPSLFRQTPDVTSAARSTYWIGLLLCLLFSIFGRWQIRELGVLWSSTEILWDPLAFGELGGALMIVSALGPSLHSRPFISNSLRLLGMGVAIVLVALSGSRGQLGVMLLVSLLIAPTLNRGFRFTRALGIMFAVAVLAFVAIVVLSQQVEQDIRWSKEQALSDLFLRTDAIAVVLEVWARGAFSIVFGLGNSASYAPTLVGTYPHVVTLEVLAEQGLIGFSLFIAILALTVRNALSILILGRRVNEDLARAAAVWIGLFLFMFILSWKQGSMLTGVWIFSHAIVLERLRGMLLAEVRHTAEVSPVRLPRDLVARERSVVPDASPAVR